MKKSHLFIPILTITLAISSLVANAQNEGRFALKAGTGYFGNIWYKVEGPTGELEGYNPRKYETHNGSGIFFELSYKFDNNYTVGAKFLKAETKKPYNNYKLATWINGSNSIATYNSFEFFFSYDFKIKRHHILLGAGPLICKLSESEYDGITNNLYTDEWGHQFAVLTLNDRIINERHFWDLGFNPKIDYEYMINPSIGVGLKAETYILAFLGVSYVYVGPTVVFKY
jgi:hypothetical protein